MAAGIIDSWSLIKHYFLTKKLNSIVERKDYIRTMKSMGVIESTCDSIRCTLKAAGYVGVMGDVPGKYFIYKHPDKKLTLRKLQEEAYGRKK